jgi:hypothetical protein
MVFKYLLDLKAKNLANNRGRKTDDNCHIIVNEIQRNKPQTRVIRPSSEKKEETIGGSLKKESIVAKRDKTGKEKEPAGNKVVSVADALGADEVGLMRREEEDIFYDVDSRGRKKRGRRLKEEVKLKK